MADMVWGGRKNVRLGGVRDHPPWLIVIGTNELGGPVAIGGPDLKFTSPTACSALGRTRSPFLH